MRSEPTQERAKDLEPESVPGVRVRYVVSAVHLTHRDSAQPLARNVINVEIRIILAPNVGPNSWEEETDDLTAHPEDVRTKTNVNSPGREVTRGPKVHIVLSQPPFKDHSGNLHGESTDLHGDSADLHGQQTRDLHGAQGTEFFKTIIFYNLQVEICEQHQQ